MRASTRMWQLVATALFALVLPTVASAGEDLLAEFGSSEVCAADEAPAAEAAPEQEPISIEELEQLFGANRLCNVPCGQPFRPKCSVLCGDAAACFNGHCIYL